MRLPPCPRSTKTRVGSGLLYTLLLDFSSGSSAFASLIKPLALGLQHPCRAGSFGNMVPVRSKEAEMAMVSRFWSQLSLRCRTANRMRWRNIAHGACCATVDVRQVTGRRK